MKTTFSPGKQRWLMAAAGFLLLAAKGNAQTGLVVTYYNGTSQSYSIATTGKLYFDNSNLQIVSAEGASPVSIPVSIIGKLTFNQAALPLTLVDFSLSNEKEQVSLSWRTENEVNASHFLVERSTNGTSYESIGRVEAYNSSTGGKYGFADQHPVTGLAYYRLKQVDADGKYQYSKTLTVNRTASEVITIAPNPASSYIRLNSTKERMNVKVISLDGRVLISGVYTPNQQISIAQLNPGIYMVSVDDKTFKLVKQ